MSKESPFEAIAAHFRNQVASGTLQAGEKLPTIREIADKWGVARATAGRAIETLRADGTVITAGRKGTVVADKQEKMALTFVLDGAKHVAVSSVEVLEADMSKAAELGVQVGSSILILHLRCEMEGRDKSLSPALLPEHGQAASRPGGTEPLIL